MAAFSISEPFPTFHGADGAPLQDGFIYIGTANQDPQTNPAQVYWDSALTIAASQPLRTINGYVSQYGTPARVYVNADDFSIRVCDKNNIPVYAAASSVSSIPFSEITGQIDASRVNYNQGNALAITRTVLAKLQDTVSVFDFMTAAQIADVQAGTLTYDVTTNIQNAINAASDVYFPPGAYRIGSGGGLLLNYTVGKVLRGAGRGKTILYNMGTSAAIASTGNGFIGNWNVRIADLAIKGQAGTTTGIVLSYTFRSTIERVEISSCGTDGIKTQNCGSISFVDVWSHGNTGCGLALGLATSGCHVRGGTFTYNTNDGILLSAEGSTAPDANLIEGAHVGFNTGKNIEVIDANRTSFIGCKIETNSTYATAFHALVTGAAGSSLNTLFQGCQLTGTNNGATIVAFEADKGTDTVVDSCYIDGPTTLTANALRTRFVNTTLTITPTDNAFSTYFIPARQYTFATLPTPGALGRIAAVSDGAAALGWGVNVSGGGTTPYVVMDNGLHWTVMGK